MYQSSEGTQNWEEGAQTEPNAQITKSSLETAPTNLAPDLSYRISTPDEPTRAGQGTYQIEPPERGGGGRRRRSTRERLRPTGLRLRGGACGVLASESEEWRRAASLWVWPSVLTASPALLLCSRKKQGKARPRAAAGGQSWVAQACGLLWAAL
jgi:hypothetical protein